MTVRTIDDIFRDFNIDGVPSSGPFNPYKADIRDTLKKLLEGLSTFPDNRVIRLNNANEGTASEIKVTASVAIPAAAYQVLYVLNVTQENTGPVKVSGAINRKLVTNTSQTVPSGYLTPGMAVLCIDTGTELRMLSYGDVESVVEELAASAEVARLEAETARDQAANYASDALSGGMDPGLSATIAVPAITIPAAIRHFSTGGYTLSGDGGGGLFRKVASEPSHAGKAQSGDGAWWELISEPLSPLMFGAPSDGITTSDAAINATIALAKARGQKFIDGNGLKYKVSSRTAISNLYGVELRNMYLIEDVTGGNIQINTYADQNQRWFGKEYLWAVYNWIKKTSNPIKVYAYGDSTMQAPSGWPDNGTPWAAFWQSMWPRLAKLKGFKQPLIATNRGVGGQSVSGMDFAADLADGMQLMLIKYGINDATTSPDPDVALKAFAEALDAKLTAIRNHANGSIYTLSIILMGPSSTFDPASDRDASWFERLRGVYEAAARKHGCFYSDTYGYMQDSRWAIGAWLDDAGLHPEAIGSWWIFAHLFDLVFPDYELEYWRRNLSSNTAGAVFEPFDAHNRNEEYFNWGQNLNIATVPNGFPQHGGLLTLFQADRPGMQLLFPSNGKPNFNARAYDITSESFGVWTGVTQGISFQNGWQEFDFAAYGASYCVRTLDGDVRVRLCIRGGTALSAGDVIGVLPAGYRPSSIEQFTSFNLAGTIGRIDVTTAGNIRIVGGVTDDMLNASFAFRAS